MVLRVKGIPNMQGQKMANLCNIQMLDIIFSVTWAEAFRTFICLGQSTPVKCCWTERYVPTPLGKLLSVVLLFSRAMTALMPLHVSRDKG